MEIFQSRKDDIGVVLLDWMLPGLSGQEVSRRIRTINRDIRVIFTSAYDPRVAEGAVSGEGSATFLQKPYTFSDLMAHVDRPNSGRISIGLLLFSGSEYSRVGGAVRVTREDQTNFRVLLGNQFDRPGYSLRVQRNHRFSKPGAKLKRQT